MAGYVRCAACDWVGVSVDGWHVAGCVGVACVWVGGWVCLGGCDMWLGVGVSDVGGHTRPDTELRERRLRATGHGVLAPLGGGAPSLPPACHS